MTEEKYQAYDYAILNLMRNHPECRTFQSILERAREDKYLETIVHNALNHLFDDYKITLPNNDRSDIRDKNCNMLLVLGNGLNCKTCNIPLAVGSKQLALCFAQSHELG